MSELKAEIVDIEVNVEDGPKAIILQLKEKGVPDEVIKDILKKAGFTTADVKATVLELLETNIGDNCQCKNCRMNRIMQIIVTGFEAGTDPNVVLKTAHDLGFERKLVAKVVKRMKKKANELTDLHDRYRDAL